MKGSFRRNGTRTVIFAILLGIIAVGSWQTVAAKENSNDSFFSSVFAGFSNLFVENKTKNLAPVANVVSEDPVIGTCDTAGPIEIESSGGTTTPTAYATLKAAFDAINAGTHTGSINVEVCGNTTETATASINASGTGSTSYTDVTVRPVGGSRIIEGSLSGTTAGAIVKLNGADNVTIDGRQGGTGTARDLTIRNNSNGASAAAIWVSSVAADAGATNNIIRNLEVAAGPANVNGNNTFGIIMCGTSIAATTNGTDNDNNQFLFNRVISARYGIVTRGTTTNNNIAPIVSNNIIGPVTGFGPDQITKTGILMQADTDAIVSGNTVQFVGADFANATSGADRVGIGIGTDSTGLTATTTLTSGGYTVTNNIIHDVVEERTFSAVGIVVGTTRGGSPTNNLIANNFIYNVRANGTSLDQTSGITVHGGNSDKIVFNSISLTGDIDPPSASAPATIFGNGIRIVGTNAANNANFTVADNSILIDLSSDTATVHFYPITLSNSSYNFGTGFLDYNNYYINPANPQLFTGGLATAAGASATTEFATLADWKTALSPPQDSNSIQADPLYISNTADLHIAANSPNVNAGIFTADITNDIDGQLRVGIPDIGADEPAGTTPVPNDIAALVIVNPDPGSTVATGTSVTPQAVFKNVGTATQTNVQVQFSIAGPGGFNYTDTQIIASLDPNQSVTVTFAATATITVVGTYTTTAALVTPDSNSANDSVMGMFNAIDPITGTINVGTGQAYTSLTNPGGLFEAINIAGATGNIVINITSDLTGESGSVALNEVAGGFTVTIKPSGEARTISGASGGAGLIGFNGADGVTIDGSLSGGTDRSLTILSGNGGNTGGGIYFASGTGGAQNNTVKNVNVMGAGSTTGILLGIAFAGNTFGAVGLNNDGNRVENCDIRGAFYGIASLGASAANKDTGVVITKNVMPGTGTSGIGRIGIYVIYADGAQITENNIASVSNPGSVDTIGIAAGSQALSATPLTTGGISNVTISRNYVGVVSNIATFSAAGIVIASDTTGTNNVTNNMVTGVTGNSNSGDIVAGIYVNGLTGSIQNIYHNSVSMTGDRLPVTANMFPSYALALSSDQTINVVDNALFNSQTRTGSPGGGGESFAIGFDGPAANVNMMSNYNDLYVSGPIGAVGITGDLTSTSQTTSAGTGTVQTTLAAWQSATSEDANSISTDPMWTSATDLHIPMTSPLVNAGTDVGVTTDFDGQTRDAMRDIGADEFVAGMPGTVQFGAATYSFGEGAGNAVIEVTRTGGSSGAITVDYTLANGTATGGANCGVGIDYVNTGGTVSLANGEMSKTFNVPLCDDAVFEGDETFTSSLSNATGGATIGMPSTTTVTITDNDTAMNGSLQFSSATYSIGEGGGMATISVTRTGGSDGSVSANYATSNGTATGGGSCGGAVDYVTSTGTVTFANGDTTTKTFDVPICDDMSTEGDETVNLALSNATGGATIGSPSSAVLTITDNDGSTGPVTVTASAGTASGTYNTLTEAVAAINDGTHQGNVVVNVNQTISEPGTVVINSSGAGAASYTSILIRPGADGVTVSGASVQGRGLIELNGADNVTIDGDNPTTAGINRNLTLQNTAPSTTTFTSVVRIALATTVVNSADNNAFKNLNILGSATGRNISGATSTTASENTTFGIFAGPGGSTASDTNAPANVTSVLTSVGAGATASNLTISNNSIGTAARGVSMNGSATSVFPGLQINQNTIGNPTAGDADQIYSIGITAQGSLDAVIAENTVWVEGYVASSAATHGINVGVNSALITGATIERNRINRVMNNNPATWSAFGINLGGGSSHVVRNNFVSGVINSQTAGTGGFGTTFGAFGIRVASGTGHTIYHNSVNLYGMLPGVTSTDLTAAFLMTATTQTGLDVRNNIFSNQITGGNPAGTRHAAVYLPSGATSALNLTLNNNAYFVGTDANSLLAKVGTTFGALEYQAGDFDPTQTTPATNFRAYTSTLSAAGTNDNASFASSAPPPFTSDVDLHIPAGTGTRLESGGAAVGVVDDIDLETRNSVTPDIGADEFAGQPPPANDIAAVAFINPMSGDVVPVGASFSPQASFTNNGTATQTNVTVRYQIIDSSMNVIYNETANIPTIAPLQVVTVTFQATMLPGPGTYTIRASSELAGDQNTGNDLITGSLTGVSPIGGTINVGTGETYTSLTNPGGVFEALNTAGISGNLTVNITSDLTGETGAVPLNQLAEAGAGGYTVTFKPSGAARTISGTSATSSGLIVLNGADRIVFDGSLAGGSDRSLTITNNQTGTSTVIWIRSGSAVNGANSNTIKNSIINGASTASAQTTAGILAGSGVTIGGPAEAPNNDNTITNNHIYGVQNSIYNQGNTGFDQNWTITDNELGSTVEADKNRFRGMLMGNANNFLISGNTVLGVTNFTGTTGANSGIQLAFVVTNGTLTNNRISNVHNLSATGTGAFGLQLSATPTTNVLIANNFIWDIQAVGSATVTSNGHGITVNGAATAGGYKIYHNSINLNTNQTSGTTAALNITSAVVASGVIDLRNNILANTQTAGATRFSVFSAAPASVFTTIDYNDYFSTGSVGSIGGTVRATLADWQAATGQDANSKAVDPLFVSAADLHIQAGSPMVDMGVNGTGVTTDIDGDARDSMPDIGADEIVQGPTPGTLQFSSPTFSNGEADGTATITVTRTGGSSGTVTVNYATSNGTATGGASCTAGIDYVSTSGTLTFMDGVTSQTFNVTICDDATDEPDETINYTLSNPTGGATIGTPGTAVQTIVDNDGPAAMFSFSIGDAKVVEGDSGTVNAVFTVTLANLPASNIGGTLASVQYSTANGTAIAGSDYVATSGTLNFSSTGTMTISVPVNGDTLKESNEFFFVNLSNPSANAVITDGQGVGIIVDRDRAYLADYDRDLKADFSVYRPSNSTFYVSNSSNGFPIFQTMGAAGDIPVPGDYDGDGKTDFALFRPSTGDWTILRSSDNTTTVANWGLGTDKPVQGDYDGDGKTDLAVYRPSEGTWYILPSGSGLFYAVNFGISTDRLVQADYDGDFKTDIAVYRDGTWYVLRSSNGGVTIQNWGLAGDKPAVGDFDGDGRNDLTVYRDGDWYIYRSLTNDFIALKWGVAGDIPVVADYDGDGTSDIAVFRPSGGVWYIIQSSNSSSVGFQWGQNGDVPTPASYLPQ